MICECPSIGAQEHLRLVQMADEHADLELYMFRVPCAGNAGTAEGWVVPGLMISHTCPLYDMLFVFRQISLNELISSKIFLVLPGPA